MVYWGYKMKAYFTFETLEDGSVSVHSSILGKSTPGDPIVRLTTIINAVIELHNKTKV